MSALEPLIAPLREAYRTAGGTLPLIEPVEPDQIPEPYRSLLVHEQDMTPTLERFHGQTLQLRMQKSRRTGSTFWRQVVIVLHSPSTPVEFGAINIYLDRFSPGMQKVILENQRPLGGILQDHVLAHTSRPQAYFRISTDQLINEVLHLTGNVTLFGRCNRLLDATQQPLADIVEILPPAGSTQSRE